MDKIKELIDEISTLYQSKGFYKVMITERKKKVLDYSMDLLMKQEKEWYNRMQLLNIINNLICKF